MRIDVILESNNAPERIRDLGVLAEQCGLGGVWVSNMNDARDPFINFVPLAMSTRRIRIGPIAVSPFELHPLKMASALLTLNEVSQGRAQIVVGAGGGTVSAMGLKPQRVVRAVRECIEILRLAASGEPVRYAGELFKVRWYDARWARSTPPAVYAGANGPQMLRSAARHADGVMVSDFVLDQLRWARGEIDSALTAAGRDPAAFPLNNFWAWHVKPTREEAELVNRNTTAFIRAYQRKSDVIEGVPGAIVRKLVHGCTSACSIDELDGEIERLRGFRDAGLTQIALRIYDKPEDTIRLLGERLVPALAD